MFMKTKSQISYPKNGTLIGSRKITYGGPNYKILALSAQTGIQKHFPKLMKTTK